MSIKFCKFLGKNIETMKLKSFYYRWKQPHAYISYTIDTLTLIGDFEKASGYVFGGELPRAGVANFTLGKMFAFYSF